ncbi:GH19363 [Drosophila grimshawi]|uniref:GH19363 n=1 Tax=Drosophila grimshawi TaxID=7222 RepID=B4JFP3_DROGR|nr:GH19363 [Drosophila grimshawi]
MTTEAKTDQTASKVPDWVQADLFVDVLKESVKGFSKIKSFKAAGGTAAGENYATVMLRVSIEVELEDGKEKSVSYMLKLPHDLEMYKKMMESNNIFEAEFNMYKTVVPELEQIYRDAGVEVKFGATAYELKGAKSDYILLEDLAPKGFKNTNRLEGLDQAHTEVALRKLSMWHAASAVRVATKGPYSDQLKDDGKEKSVSYMLKLPHDLEMYKKMMESNNIFEAEFNMYKTVVPELEQIYRDAGVEVKFGATAYELKGAKSDYILLEDLAPKGFKNTNRLDGLDQAHTEVALRKLSMWHAASAVRVATKGPYSDQLTIGFYKEELRPMLTEMNNNLQQNFLKSCKLYDGNEEYIDRVKEMQSQITDQIYKMSKIDENDFNALNHGDFWSNNMMYSHDSFGKIKEIRLVDFQIPKFGTVAQDLYYFLLSSTKLEDKIAKFDYYIKMYHECLLENLKILNYSKHVPTLREIHLTLFKYGFWGYLTASGVMSAVLVDPTETANFENFLSDSTEGNDFKMLLYSNSRYRKHIQIIMPWLLNRGAFDEL